MAREIVWVMSKEQAGRRVGRILTSDCGVSAHRYAKLKQAEAVLLDGAPAHANVRVRCGQTLTIRLEEETAARAETPEWAVYEDDDLLIVNKPAPLSSMRSAHQAGETLEMLVTEYLGSYRPVNRLDKGTSGLMLVAKTAYAQARAQKMLHTEDFLRAYVAVLDGCPKEMTGVIDLPIAPGEGVKRRVAAQGKPCETFYRVMGQTLSGRTVVELRLHTGRTHQIRVHMAAIGCPVTGDYLYGAEHALLPGRFALHSAHIRLRQPVCGAVIERFCPPPAVFFRL